MEVWCEVGFCELALEIQCLCMRSGVLGSDRSHKPLIARNWGL
jgi:hypothetical protein